MQNLTVLIPFTIAVINVPLMLLRYYDETTCSPLQSFQYNRVPIFSFSPQSLHWNKKIKIYCFSFNATKNKSTRRAIILR